MFHITISILFIVFIVAHLFGTSMKLVFKITLLLIVLVVLSERLGGRSVLVRHGFFRGLHSHSVHTRCLKRGGPTCTKHLLSESLRLASFRVPKRST